MEASVLIAVISIITAGLSITIGTIAPALAEGRVAAQALSSIAQQPDAASALADAGVHFDLRRTGMRLSPHIYTSREEIETVISCLAPFARAAV